MDKNLNGKKLYANPKKKSMKNTNLRCLIS